MKLTSFYCFTQGRYRRLSKSGRGTPCPIRSGTSCTSYRCRTSTDHCGRGLQPPPAAGGETVCPKVPCLSFLTGAPHQGSYWNTSPLPASWRGSSLEPDTSFQADGPVWAHFHASSATAACRGIHRNGGLPERNRLGRTDRLASSTQRTRCFVDTRDRGWVTGAPRSLARPARIELLPGKSGHSGSRKTRGLRWSIATACSARLAHPSALRPSTPHSASTGAPATTSTRRSRAVTSRHNQPSFCWAASSSAIRLLISPSVPSECSA